MEENVEKTDGLRVTRARTRRQSVLDTDSRPGTPQLELAPDRGTASPRPLRRTRLNSTTIDLRTPTRTTRRSVARGETPEPVTPSASATKRPARTPAKSARKQLPLHEEEEDSHKIKEEPISRTPTPTGEKRVTRSMSKTPPFPNNREATVSPAPGKQLSKPTETESGKTPIQGISKVVVKVKEISRTLLTSPLTNSEMLAQSQEKDDSIVVPMEVDETDTAKPESSINLSTQQPGENVETVSLEKSQAKTASTDSLKKELSHERGTALDDQKSEMVEENVLEESLIIQGKVQIDPKEAGNISVGKILDSVLVENSIKQVETVEENQVLTVEKTVEVSIEETISLHVDTTEKENVVVESKASPKPEMKVHIAKEKLSVDNTNEDKDKMEPEETNNNVVHQDNVEADPIKVISNVRLPDLLPVSSPTDKKADAKKTVVFNTALEEDKNEKKRTIEKKEFPRTPCREKPPLSSVMIKSFMERNRESPLKPEIAKARHSSTPIQKGEGETSLSKPVEATVSPPAQIDAIKPLVQPMEVVPKSSPPPKVVPLRLVSDDEDDEDVESDAEEISLFVDNEVEVADDNYQSGDSMDSSERREIEENEVPCDGESVGSQDTIESVGDEESDDSFIVSDNDIEEDDAVDDIEPLCWENDELEEEVASNTSKGKKQRRRIMVVDSSDEDEDEEKLEPEPEAEKNLSNASQLSEAAKLLNRTLEDTHDDAVLESSRKISHTDCLNKTASRLEISTVDLSTTVEDTSDEEAEPQVEKVVVVEQHKPSASTGEDDYVEPEPQEEPEAVAMVPKPSTPTGQVENEEEVLLAELASSDLSHLQKMFNPLQKARRQSLYIPSPEQMAKKEPKLKRRSERMLHDFNPSQSFMEMLAEKQRQQSPRKRLSKSFCGAADDDILEEAEQIPFKSEQELEQELEQEPEQEPEQNPEIAVPKDEERAADDEILEEETEIALPKDGEHNKKEEAITTTSSPTDPPANKKSIDHYMKYCDKILEAASQAKLQQKKLAVAARAVGAKKKKKNSNPSTVEVVDKRKVKRLVPGEKQALQKAVDRAIQLLAPPIQKESRPLSRKISPQPPFPNDKAKDKGNKSSVNTVIKKQKQVVSPVKSSDEENHFYQQPIERFKNNAGVVNVYRDDSPPRKGLELIKTRSGIMRVEPSTPPSKYFQEMPITPKNRKRCFHEEALTPKDRPAKRHKQKAPEAAGSSGAAGRKHNSATESAMRFRNRVLARK